jgi:threonine dehydratase
VLTFDDIQSARRSIAGKVHVTPVFTSTAIGRAVGATVYLKAELFQKTGSFKPRGALNKIQKLTPEQKAKGLITVSAGNHAQGLAYAAATYGVACTVVMPESASPTKVRAAQGYGATVVQHGDVGQAFDYMFVLQKERDLTFVHPFDDPDIMAGQGTLGLEIVEQVSEFDAVVVGVGGGGLIAGIATAIKHLRPHVKIVGVEPVGAAKMRRSLDEGWAVRLDRVVTIADGLAPPMAGQHTYPIVKALADDVVTVTDEQIVAGMTMLMSRCKLMAEPAGAAAVGALLAGAVRVPPGSTVVAVVSGGNVDLDELCAILRAAAPA